MRINIWNDFSYYTSYHLHASGRVTDNQVPFIIGHLRILRSGQTKGSDQLLGPGAIDDLGAEFCSMASSLDYYERVSQLTENYRDRILLALRDCIIYPDIREDFKREDGFRTSLMRDITSKDEIFELAPLLISRDFRKLINMGLSFEFKMPMLQTPFEFNFDSPSYGFTNNHLPNRIAVIIGRNGSGKSTVLSRISRIAFSSTTDRKNRHLRKLGSISPKGLGFPRIIFLSYSAFDAFALPGIYKSDKETILKEMENGLGRYVFCGIRDIVGELKEAVGSLRTDSEGKLLPEDILRDQVENTRLKSLKSLAEEFVRNINIIVDTDKESLLTVAINVLSKEKSMHDLIEDDWMAYNDKQLLTMFMQLSTGHKFVVHAITSIIAYTETRSLLLFDEPETHLHPPILAVLMKAIRKVLDKKNAFMIASTHSPVLLQETLKQHVHVIQKEGDLIDVSRPEIETFGENTGILTQTAFGLTAEVTDYHSTLNKLIGTYTEQYFGSDDPEEALDMIENVFPHGLSMQARSYVLSKLYKKQS